MESGCSSRTCQQVPSVNCRLCEWSCHRCDCEQDVPHLSPDVSRYHLHPCYPVQDEQQIDGQIQTPHSNQLFKNTRSVAVTCAVEGLLQATANESEKILQLRKNVLKNVYARPKSCCKSYKNHMRQRSSPGTVREQCRLRCWYVVGTMSGTVQGQGGGGIGLLQVWCHALCYSHCTAFNVLSPSSRSTCRQQLWLHLSPQSSVFAQSQQQNITVSDRSATARVVCVNSTQPDSCQSHTEMRTRCCPHAIRQIDGC